MSGSAWIESNMHMYVCVYEYVHMLLMPPADALFMYFIQK